MQITFGLQGASLQVLRQDLREWWKSTVALAHGHQVNDNEKVFSVREIFLSQTTRQDSF